MYVIKKLISEHQCFLLTTHVGVLHKSVQSVFMQHTRPCPFERVVYNDSKRDPDCYLSLSLGRLGPRRAVVAVQISEKQQGEVLVVSLEGRLDAATSPVVERKLSEKIEGGVTKLVLNFAGVDYLSSAGMRLLLTVSKKLVSLKGKLAVSNISDEVMEVIKMAGFDRVLDIHATEADAVGSF